jgi:hypothetical protein
LAIGEKYLISSMFLMKYKSKTEINNSSKIVKKQMLVLEGNLKTNTIKTTNKKNSFVLTNL